MFSLPYLDGIRREHRIFWRYRAWNLPSQDGRAQIPQRQRSSRIQSSSTPGDYWINDPQTPSESQRRLLLSRIRHESTARLPVFRDTPPADS